MSNFFKRRKARRELRELFNHATTTRAMREDVMTSGELHRLDEAMAVTQNVLSTRNAELETLQNALEQLHETILQIAPPKRFASWRSNFEVLVVALSVAMAFRAYFYQPFKIPTGSMQPTLYGIQSRAQDGPTTFDKLPLKYVRWIVTGEWYREVRVGAGGEVYVVNDERKPGYTALRVAGVHYYIPSDAVRERREVKVGADRRVASGAVLWSGIVTAGDFVFVNRWRWHFMKPRRGEVMVFATQGIEGLPPGTHYIKRMCGVPNETLAINPPDLLINGEPVYEPYTIGRVARKEKIGEWAPPYTGYAVIGNMPAEFEHAIRKPGDSVTLGPQEYFALGDNTYNSRDSRYWGIVPARNLVGPATLVYWPFTSHRFGWIH